MKRYIKKQGRLKFFFITSFMLLCMPPAFAADESLSHIGKLPPTKAIPIAWGKDPFIPVVRQAALPDVKLTAVFFGSVNPSAILNDRIVYKGSVINGQKVIDIGRTHVILQGDAGTIKLEIAGIPEFPDGAK